MIDPAGNFIAANLLNVRARIAQAAHRAGREASAVTLVAVSKLQTPQAIAAAYAAGQRVFGENFVQEAKRKKTELVESCRELQLHLTGQLQRNKVKDAVALFDLIQTIHRKEVAEEIEHAAAKLNKILPVLLQVNISGEGSKSGCAPEGVQALSEEIQGKPHLRLLGLMSIGSYFAGDASDAQRRSEFVAMRHLRDQVAAKLGVPLEHLSMGMSGDFELAIEEGATIVRVGSEIFGAR